MLSNPIGHKEVNILEALTLRCIYHYFPLGSKFGFITCFINYIASTFYRYFSGKDLNLAFNNVISNELGVIQDMYLITSKTELQT